MVVWSSFLGLLGFIAPTLRDVALLAVGFAALEPHLAVSSRAPSLRCSCGRRMSLLSATLYDVLQVWARSAMLVMALWIVATLLALELESFANWASGVMGGGAAYIFCVLTVITGCIHAKRSL